jgi:hypothetical protein
MEWKIAYDKLRGLVEATVVGTIQAEQVAEMAVQIISVARENLCHKCLIDYRCAEAKFSTLDAYSFMTRLEQLGAMRNDMVAIVYSRDAADHRFAETVALNRGWVNVRYFSDKESATNWLSTKDV